MLEDYKDEETSADLLDFYNDNLIEGNFDLIDSCLSNMQLSHSSTVDMLLVATITYHGKKHLTTRDDFITRVEVELIKRHGEERALKLLELRR